MKQNVILEDFSSSIIVQSFSDHGIDEYLKVVKGQ